jgi:5-methylcytosine-specific restriction protein A
VTRLEFSKATRKAALIRSGGICEAMGAVYGLEPGERCTASLAYGVEYDHYPKSALDEDSNGLDNCVACCPAHHKHKTRTYDIPMQAKGRRIRRALGPEELRKKRKAIPSPAHHKWPSRKFESRRKDV